jgi:hypothetical protein
MGMDDAFKRTAISMHGDIDTRMMKTTEELIKPKVSIRSGERPRNFILPLPQNRCRTDDQSGSTFSFDLHSANHFRTSTAYKRLFIILVNRRVCITSRYPCVNILASLYRFFHCNNINWHCMNLPMSLPCFNIEPAISHQNCKRELRTNLCILYLFRLPNA